MDLKSTAVAKWPESSPALFNTVATTTTSAFRSSISRSGRNSVDSPYTTVAPERTRKQLLFSFLFFLPLVGGGGGRPPATASSWRKRSIVWKVLWHVVSGSRELTRSETPPGTIVLTTTPVLLPPMMPNPSPDPSLIRSTTSTWAHSVLSCHGDKKRKKEIDYKMKKKTKIRVTGHIHSP